MLRFLGSRADVDRQFEVSQQEIENLREQQTNGFEKRFPGLVSLFSKSKEQRDALVREQFGSVEADENVIDSFLCSAYLKDRTLPITGNLVRFAARHNLPLRACLSICFALETVHHRKGHLLLLQYSQL